MLIEWLPEGCINWGKLPPELRKIGIPTSLLKDLNKLASHRGRLMPVTLHVTREASVGTPRTPVLNFSVANSAIGSEGLDGTPPDGFRVDPLQSIAVRRPLPALCHFNPHYLVDLLKLASLEDDGSERREPTILTAPVYAYPMAGEIAASEPSPIMANNWRTAPCAASPDVTGYLSRRPHCWCYVIMAVRGYALNGAADLGEFVDEIRRGAVNQSKA